MVAETFRLWDPVNYLHSKESICSYFVAALEDDPGDGRLVQAVVDDIARALDEKGIEQKFAISSEELRNAISDDSLSFATVFHIARSLEMKLTATTADPAPEEICYKNISREEAQGEILDLLATDPNLCYDDISDQLQIEMELVVEICLELEDKGIIKVSD